MNYTVVWQRTTRDRLAELWMAATDRAALARASDEIDVELARDPLAVGEGRAGDNRILLAPPLAVFYRVSQSDRLVTVWDVWTT